MPHYDIDSATFSEYCWEILKNLLVKLVTKLNQGGLSTLQANSSSCSGFAKSIQNINSLKPDAKSLVRLVFIWRAYSVWKKIVTSDEILVWLPENKWDGDVDKIIDEFSEASSDKSSPPSKRSRSSRERRITLTATQTEIHLVPPCEPLDEAYGLCAAAVSDLVSSTDFVKSANKHLKLIKYFPDIHKFISEALIFKLKASEAILHLNERALELPDESKSLTFNTHLVCANILERNYADAFTILVSLLPQSFDWSEREKAFESSVTDNLHIACQQRFCVIKTQVAVELVFDYLHHILYKVYTSTTLNHENDELLGSLLILSQINFYVHGYQSFNRIMRHIEAKGSLNYPGLGKYITNVTILEELARIQDFCSEYVSIQIAVPQVQRRIGQSTRHSIRGTRDGQKHCIEEQMKKDDETPIQSVIAYFTDNQDNILQILKK